MFPGIDRRELRDRVVPDEGTLTHLVERHGLELVGRDFQHDLVRLLDVPDRLAAALWQLFIQEDFKRRASPAYWLIYRLEEVRIRFALDPLLSLRDELLFQVASLNIYDHLVISRVFKEVSLLRDGLLTSVDRCNQVQSFDSLALPAIDEVPAG